MTYVERLKCPKQTPRIFEKHWRNYQNKRKTTPTNLWCSHVAL